MEDFDSLTVPDLKGLILNLLLEIPEGMVTSYKDMATALGDKKAARAVGKVLSENDRPDIYPCWRVVHSDGGVGKYSGQGGVETKIRNMRREGISVEGGKVADFNSCRFECFDVEPPLTKLREIQREIEPTREWGRFGSSISVAGVDVSYYSNGAVAGYVEMERGEDEPIQEYTIFVENLRFPYIPGYLAFRELPVLKKLLEKVKREGRLAEVIFVDGNGLLHPRRAGLASHLGVLLDHSTVGVAKSLLCGEVDESGQKVGEERKVTLGEEVVGASIKTYKPANPIYLSVGHKVTLDQSVRLVREGSKYKLPESLRRAHKLAKNKAAKL